MTLEQLAAVKLGDRVRLRSECGKVTQTSVRWFMVTWENGGTEIVQRRSSIMTRGLELDSV